MSGLWSPGVGVGYVPAPTTCRTFVGCGLENVPTGVVVHINRVR